MRKKTCIVGFIVILILIADQSLKIWVKSTFSLFDQPLNIAGSWFRIVYIENPGMAFGTTFGASMWSKLALSLFRVFAIGGIAYYWWKQAKNKASLEFLIAIGFIFSGAIGNLIDSMFYDLFFKFDPCMSFNQMEGSGVYQVCSDYGRLQVRHQGFLFGNVVDMFQFNMRWPNWMPFLSGKDVFSAIWNLADGSITVGVLMVLIRQRTYFPKEIKEQLISDKDLSVNDDHK